MGAFILIGFILAILPGLIFSVWYYFALIIAVVEESTVDPLKLSKQLVRGKFWPVAGRILLFTLLYLAPNILFQRINIYLTFLWSIFMPYFTLVTVLFYLDLKSTKNVA